MTVKTLLCTSATIVVVILTSTLLFQGGLAVGSPKCSEDDFPCANGECIESVLWCDSHVDCADGSDEKLCRKNSIFNKDPNKCPSIYFKCNDGPCIPMVGRCNGYEDCSDSSDEKNCTLPEGSNTSEDVTTTPTESPTNEIDEFDAIQFFTSLNVSENVLNAEKFSGLAFSAFSAQRNLARNWLLSQRGGDFGWGDDTPRAIIALYLSEMKPTLKSAEIDILMIKQLEIQLSLDIARNETKPMKLTDLALYINALHLSCKNPKNFYGDNLISILRDSVNTAQMKDEFINPSIYLTLCINDATTFEDSDKIKGLLLSKNTTTSRIDMKALAMLTCACIFHKTEILNKTMYDELKMEFLSSVKIHGFPGNVYEAALVFQALQELKVTLTGLTDFILKHQGPDGSFGDILSTYFVLPILAGKNMVDMKDNCRQQNTSHLAPIEVLKNMKRRKIFVQYTLKYGNPPELTQTIQMQVPEGISFIDVMRLAQENNPKYRFLLDGNREDPVVYSIGGMPNDAEKGMFWTLYTTSADRGRNDAGRLSPYSESIKKLIPHARDEFVFWMKSL